jgi:antitoxin (DNA-binding transcriptional repressor) of toxin-antitoxin stability system
MRHISSQLLDEESLNELESGHNLIVVREGKPIAQVVPINSELADSAAERDHATAVDDMLKLINKGWNLGGLRIGDRDELYDRD